MPDGGAEAVPLPDGGAALAMKQVSFAGGDASAITQASRGMVVETCGKLATDPSLSVPERVQLINAYTQAVLQCCNAFGGYSSMGGGDPSLGGAGGSVAAQKSTEQPYAQGRGRGASEGLGDSLPSAAVAPRGESSPQGGGGVGRSSPRTRERSGPVGGSDLAERSRGRVGGRGRGGGRRTQRHSCCIDDVKDLDDDDDDVVVEAEASEDERGGTTRAGGGGGRRGGRGHGWAEAASGIRGDGRRREEEAAGGGGGGGGPYEDPDVGWEVEPLPPTADPLLVWHQSVRTKARTADRELRMTSAPRLRCILKELGISRPADRGKAEEEAEEGGISEEEEGSEGSGGPSKGANKVQAVAVMREEGARAAGVAVAKQPVPHHQQQQPVPHQQQQPGVTEVKR